MSHRQTRTPPASRIAVGISRGDGYPPGYASATRTILADFAARAGRRHAGQRRRRSASSDPPRHRRAGRQAGLQRRQRRADRQARESQLQNLLQALLEQRGSVPRALRHGNGGGAGEGRRGAKGDGRGALAGAGCGGDAGALRGDPRRPDHRQSLHRRGADRGAGDSRALRRGDEIAGAAFAGRPKADVEGAGAAEDARGHAGGERALVGLPAADRRRGRSNRDAAAGGDHLCVAPIYWGEGSD